MKILITGATGLVGKALVEELKTQQISIHFLSTNKTKLNSISGAKGFYWNPRTEEIDSDCFEGVTHLIHLAGASISKRWTKSYQKEIWESRVLGTHLLAKAIKEQVGTHQLKQIVAASAVGCYPSRFESIQTEEAVLQPDTFLASVVHDWEQAIDACKAPSINVVKLRIGLVLSPLGGVVAALKWMAKVGLLTALGNGKQGQSWIHIDDLVKMLITASQQQWEGVYNAVSPHPVSQKQFMHALAKAYGSFVWLPPAPKVVIQLLYGKMSVLLFNSHWISAEKVLDKGFRFKYPHLEEALSNLS